MINIKPKIVDALNNVKGVKNVFFYYPESFTRLPCISYYEANNSPDRSADDSEYSTEVNIKNEKK